MQLTLTQSATVLGVSARTLRDRLQRGDLCGSKRGGRWIVDSHSLPMSEAQRRSMQARAEQIRAVVDSALPSRVETTRGRKRRSLADLDTFREARAVANSMRARPDDVPGLEEALAHVDAALLELAVGVHAFDRESKLVALRAAREGFSRAVGHLLRVSPEVPEEPVLGWIVALESGVLGSLAGLLRWAEKLERSPA